jgi:hypothetical protein
MVVLADVRHEGQNQLVDRDVRRLVLRESPTSCLPLLNDAPVLDLAALAAPLAQQNVTALARDEVDQRDAGLAGGMFAV